MYGSTRRIIAVALASATLVASCGSNGHGNGQGNGQGDEGVTHVGGSLLDGHLATIGTSVLTAADRTNLAYMREEERLAHDVYVALGERWGLRTFENIARAEATRDEKTIKLFFELRAGGYNGSTYTLIYDPANDILRGVYHQAVAQQKFDVYFTRTR